MDPSIAEAITADYAAAAHAKDVSAFISLYADDVRVFDLWGKWSFEGTTSWRGAVTEWFGSLGDETAEITFEDVHVTPGENLSVLSATVIYTAIAKNGEELRSMANRLTWVLTKHGGQWRISHEHSSVPINPETFKAMLYK